MTEIKGYRKLTPTQVDSMNELKTKGEEIGELLDNVFDKHFKDQGDYTEQEMADALEWFKQGRQALRVGIMLVIRSIARPTTF